MSNCREFEEWFAELAEIYEKNGCKLKKPTAYELRQYQQGMTPQEAWEDDADIPY